MKREEICSKNSEGSEKAAKEKPGRRDWGEEFFAFEIFKTGDVYQIKVSFV